MADEKQEKQLEEIKRRMGTLTLREGKVSILTQEGGAHSLTKPLTPSNIRPFFPPSLSPFLPFLSLTLSSLHLLCPSPSFLQSFQLVYSELVVVGRMGSGICGEVFHMRHKPSDFNMAAKVLYTYLLLP